jgi:putative membrane protein
LADNQPPRTFRQNRFLQVLVAWLVLFWILTAISPVSRQDWLIENLLVFAYGLLLTLTYPRFAFSNISYGLFGLFMTLHLIGAHYTYSEVPLGFWLQDLLGLGRNHYDRIVHFCYGLLLAYPMREFLLRVAGIRLRWSYLMTVISVLAFSAFYELMESVVASIVSPELGAEWLGTQGDEWDAQKDTGLAFSGSIIAMLITWWASPRN